MTKLLEKTFELKSNGTSIKQEFIAGITTFITMAYIIFVNPQMMAASGMDLGASFVGTCLAAAATWRNQLVCACISPALPQSRTASRPSTLRAQEQ